MERQAIDLCGLGLQKMWRGEIDSAIELYDRASAIAETDETRELITIRKAEALIAAGREGPEVGALPRIVMRRRTAKHVYIAAGVLMRRFVDSEDRRKAIFYGEIARSAVAELKEPFPHATVLNALAVTLVVDSQFAAAIRVIEEALEVLDRVTEKSDQWRSLRTALLANMGGAKVLDGDSHEGTTILEDVLQDLDDPCDRAEVCLDLCLGYMELGRNEVAEVYGRRALGVAAIPRQIRNANHLLGEICFRTNRHDEADEYFNVVAGFYPDFKNVKQLLVAVDLCSVVNWSQ